MKEFFNKKPVQLTIKIILTIIAALLTFYGGMIGLLILLLSEYWSVLAGAIFVVIPVSTIPLIWAKKRKKWLIFSISVIVAYGIAIGVNYSHMKYQESLVIDTSPNIKIHEYLPYMENTKIVKLENASLKLENNLPILDGAAAVFPVYSSFVYAVYPKGTKIDEKMAAYNVYYEEMGVYDHVGQNTPFQYNNTTFGYQALAKKETDIFFGAYPSKEQIKYAEENGTEFEFTQIGTEAFVFFVNKNNPISNLTTQQIKDIYSGKITNWKEVGGKNEEIVAFQRNEGSGSQSMLERFMGDTPIMNAPVDQRNDFMSGIIEEVADYKNKSSSIGFSFRYYVEGIIQNPDIKMISIDGVAPTVENIKNGTYPITTPLYAVSYKDNPNPNVQILLDWILSAEGQKIIENTGYVGVQ